MGCNKSKTFTVNSHFPGQDHDAVRDMKLIGLSFSEIQRFYRVFSKFDMTKDGHLDIIELAVALNLSDRSNVVVEFVKSVDTDSNGIMDFREFVLSMWRFCSRSQQALAAFAFEIFDTDESDALSILELKKMITFVYGNKNVDEKVKGMVTSMGGGRSTSGYASDTHIISKEEFLSTCSRFPSLLFPAFDMQSVIRRAVLGETFWNSKAKTAPGYLQKPEVQQLFVKRKHISTKSLGTIKRASWIPYEEMSPAEQLNVRRASRNASISLQAGAQVYPNNASSTTTSTNTTTTTTSQRRASKVNSNIYPNTTNTNNKTNSKDNNDSRGSPLKPTTVASNPNSKPKRRHTIGNPDSDPIQPAINTAKATVDTPMHRYTNGMEMTRYTGPKGPNYMVPFGPDFGPTGSANISYTPASNVKSGKKRRGTYAGGDANDSDTNEPSGHGFYAYDTDNSNSAAVATAVVASAAPQRRRSSLGRVVVEHNAVASRKKSIG